MNIPEAQTMAVALMKEHGLADWSFKFDRAKRRFGACHGRQKLITLSASLTELNSEAEVRNTFLHEIAHALVPREGHGPEWKRVAQSIGCTGDRCYGEHVNEPHIPFKARAEKWLRYCRFCHDNNFYFKKTARSVAQACRACCIRHNNGKWSQKYVFKWRQATAAERKELLAFAAKA